MAEVTRTDEHKYMTEGGDEYPSVTKIIGWAFDGGKSDRLIPWAVKQTVDFISEQLAEYGEKPPLEEILQSASREATRKKEDAGDIGSILHNCIECWAKDPDGFELAPFEREEVKTAFAGFKKWASEVDLSPVETEVIVADNKLKYAGTLDMIAFIMVDGKKELFLLDFKTSNYFYDIPMGTQLAAYKKAYGQKHPLYGRIEGIGVVRLNKSDGKVYFRNYTPDYDRYLDTFVMLRKIYKFWKEDGKTPIKRRSRTK